MHLLYIHELCCFRSRKFLLCNISDRQEKAIEMTACESYAVVKGGVHNEPAKVSNTDTNNEEWARVYETTNLRAVYEQI